MCEVGQGWVACLRLCPHQVVAVIGQDRWSRNGAVSQFVAPVGEPLRTGPHMTYSVTEAAAGLSWGHQLGEPETPWRGNCTQEGPERCGAWSRTLPHLGSREGLLEEAVHWLVLEVSQAGRGGCSLLSSPCPQKTLPGWEPICSGSPLERTQVRGCFLGEWKLPGPSV